MTVFFSPAPVHDYAGAAACDLVAYGAWCRALLARGVYPPASQFEAWFPSLAHGPEHIARTLEAAAEAFEEVARRMEVARMRPHATGRSRWRRSCAPQGGTAADSLLASPAPEGRDRPGPPQLAAEGPRAAGHEREYELLLEMIHEGSLLHYGDSRVLRDDDPDLSLLLGDQLYALGLARLAEIGDLDAVAELADLISLLAQAQAAVEDELASASGRPARRRSAGAGVPSTRPPRPWPAPATSRAVAALLRVAQPAGS